VKGEGQDILRGKVLVFLRFLVGLNQLVNLGQIFSAIFRACIEFGEIA